MKHPWEFTFEDYCALIEYWQEAAKNKNIFAFRHLEKLYEDVWQFYPQECVEAGFNGEVQ